MPDPTPETLRALVEKWRRQASVLGSRPDEDLRSANARVNQRKASVYSRCADELTALLDTEEEVADGAR